LAFSTTNSLAKFIKIHKAHLDPLSCCDVIYKINYKIVVTVMQVM